MIHPAGWIIYEAIRRLAHPEPLAAPAAGVIVMGLSALVNIIVSTVLFRVAERHDSIALKADAWHLRTDVYTSAGVFFGLGVIWLGRRLFDHVDLDWLDPVAALAVALLICRAAYRLTAQAARGLLDARLPADEEEWICRCLQDMVPRVSGFHKLRTRKSGAQRFVEVHMLVEPEMPVAEAHDLADELVECIKGHYPRTHVIVHIEPADENATADCGRGTSAPT
ncbi:MAG: cation transporter [Armatimonadetes bacterium]|nr:cation transporter [Armatimonadota bacterium]